MARYQMIALLAVLLCLGCGGESGDTETGGEGAAANAPRSSGEQMLEEQKLAWAADLREALEDGDPMFSAEQWTAFVGACNSLTVKIAEGGGLSEAVAEPLVKAAGLSDLEEFCEIRNAAVRLGSYLTAGGGMKIAASQGAVIGLPNSGQVEKALAEMREECADLGFTKQDIDHYLEHRQELPGDLMRWTMKFAWVR